MDDSNLLVEMQNKSWHYYAEHPTANIMKEPVRKGKPHHYMKLTQNGKIIQKITT